MDDFEKAANYFSLRLFPDVTSLTAIGKDLDELLQRIMLKQINPEFK